MLPLLTVLVLALMSAYLGENHQVLCLTNVSLTMAPDSYDDQYIGCPSAMVNQLMDPTKNEFAPGKEYTAIWGKAESYWNENKGSLQLPRNFEKDYGIALLAYTDRGSLYKNFRKAVTTGGKSTMYYAEDFHFKSFDFLVTKAVEVLKASQTGCYDVYRGIRDVSFTVPDRNKPVRFGHFASSSLNKTVAEHFGKDTFFTITTCYGANITDYSYFPKQQEVLIPPYEMFKVVDVGNEGGKTQITLHSDSKSSSFNCGFKTGAAPSSLTPGVPASFLLWGFLLFSGSLQSMGSL